jgi:hypothetical protein
MNFILQRSLHMLVSIICTDTIQECCAAPPKTLFKPQKMPQASLAQRERVAKIKLTAADVIWRAWS